MSHAANHNEALGWNPNDPHGTNTHAHGHVVVSWQIQLGVLLALLFFTGLTMAFYNAEQWAETAFNIHLPLWVNIVGAMLIASIKATLVCMYFMQLRYDKPLNTFALLFCLFAVGLFLFFSMLDLSTRGAVNEFKYGEIQSGGTGVALDAPARDARFDARVSPRVSTAGGNLINTAREKSINTFLAMNPEKTEKDWWAKMYAKQKHPHHHWADTENYFAQLGYDHSGPALSTSEKRVVRTGRTDALELAPGHGAHADHGTTSHDAGH